MRYIPHVVCIMLVFALGAILLLIVQYSVQLPSADKDMTYSDFISIILTALGVMLTALTIFLGVLAVVGWTSIESKLRDHSISYFKDQLSSEGPLRAELEELFTEIAYEGIESYKTQQQSNQEEAYRD